MIPGSKKEPERGEDQESLAEEFEQRLAQILEKYPELASPEAQRRAERWLEKEGIVEPEEGQEEG